jgi:Pentapeptide repeats (8 copies)
MANPEHVEIVKLGTNAIKKWREGNPDVRLDLYEADLIGAHLSGANLSKANLSGALFNKRTVFSKTILFRAKGVTSTRNLYSVKIRTDESEGPENFESCPRDFWARCLDWERFRIIGRMPLFSASYAVLILLPVFFFFLAYYNNSADIVNTWGKQIPEGDSAYTLAKLVKALPHIAIPSQSLILLLSTVLLAIGSTIFTFGCPSRIKEFSRDQWCDQLGHHLINYWPLAWKGRILRIVCAVCYTLGGIGAIYVIATKVYRAGRFIIQNADFSSIFW